MTLRLLILRGYGVKFQSCFQWFRIAILKSGRAGRRARARTGLFLGAILLRVNSVSGEQLHKPNPAPAAGHPRVCCSEFNRGGPIAHRPNFVQDGPPEPTGCVRTAMECDARRTRGGAQLFGKGPAGCIERFRQAPALFINQHLLRNADLDLPSFMAVRAISSRPRRSIRR
jgi:hypothetical protein